MKNPTPPQVKREIAALQELKTKIPQTNLFGDSHRDGIEAQILVLTGNLSEGQIWDRSHTEAEDDDRKEDDSLWKENVRNDALNARLWLDGESDDGPPSKGWVKCLEWIQSQRLGRPTRWMIDRSFDSWWAANSTIVRDKFEMAVTRDEQIKVLALVVWRAAMEPPNDPSSPTPL